MDRVAGLRSAEEVRRAAEARFSSRPPGPVPRSKEEKEAVLHELGVHQIELEMQNEELRRTQAELLQSRDRYSTLYNHAPVGYMTLDRAGMIVECNVTAGALFGLSRNHLSASKLSWFVCDADVLDLHLLAVLREGKHSCEIDLRHPRGRIFRARLFSVMDAETRTGPRFLCALIDISELREAQADLQQSEARFRQIAAQIEDAFYIRELDGVISYVSPAYERIWGRPASELAGKPDGWLDSIEDEDRERVS